MLKIFRNHPKKSLFLFAVLVVQYLNFTGFCYSELKYLSEDELLRRGAGKMYEEEPNCCGLDNIYSGYMRYSATERFFNNFFGIYRLGLTESYKEDVQYEGSKETHIEYRRSSGSINACGIGHGDYGENITEAEYKKDIEARKKYREKE